ncbi:hypothetical protein HK405_000139 [Cladochytrium tenue]|nr:hypothetical protein HK405_000139 [Cladochytrium tenue]
MVDLFQFSRPKALGGLVKLKIHQILQLQLEEEEILSGPSPSMAYMAARIAARGSLGPLRRLVIVSHGEVHVAQTQLAQLPLVGGLYDSGVRPALGRLALAGGGLLEASGLLDAVPWAAQAVGAAAKRAGSAAGSVANAASGAAGVVLQGASGAARAAGVPALVGMVAGAMGRAASGARGAAAALIEEGRGVQVACYAPTCRPGLACYSPTCPRGRSVTARVSVDNLRSAVRGMYVEGGRMVSLGWRPVSATAAAAAAVAAAAAARAAAAKSAATRAASGAAAALGAGVEGIAATLHPQQQVAAPGADEASTTPAAAGGAEVMAAVAVPAPDGDVPVSMVTVVEGIVVEGVEMTVAGSDVSIALGGPESTLKETSVEPLD